MKSLFPEHFPLTDEQLAELWADGLLVFDTNVLLRLYRYRESTTEEILKIFADSKDRLWIPYQVAWEYNRRRDSKIKEAVKSYTDIVSDLRKAAEGTKLKLQGLKEFGVHPQVGLDAELDLLATDIVDRTDAVSSKYSANPTAEHYATIHSRLGDIFEGQIGPPPSEEDLIAAYQVGQDRFDSGIPPGLKDVPEKRKSNRPDREVFGDYLIWKGILEHAKALSKPVIFVTEDAKEDWWLKEEGRTLGPLPELRKEFISEVGKQVHFYRVGYFLEQARERISAQVSTGSVEDVQATAPEGGSSDQFEIKTFLSWLAAEPAAHAAQEFSDKLSLIKSYTHSSEALDEEVRYLLSVYNDAQKTYERFRARYRALGKSVRSDAAKGNVPPDLMRIRNDYLEAKRVRDQALTRLNKCLESYAAG